MQQWKIENAQHIHHIPWRLIQLKPPTQHSAGMVVEVSHAEVQPPDG